MKMPLKATYHPVKFNDTPHLNDNQFRVRTALPNSRNDQFESHLSFAHNNGHSLPVSNNDSTTS
jgi:hypothetical protein